MGSSPLTDISLTKWQRLLLTAGICILDLTPRQIEELNRLGIYLVHDLFRNEEIVLGSDGGLTAEDVQDIEIRVRKYFETTGIPLPLDHLAKFVAPTVADHMERSASKELGADRAKPQVLSQDIGVLGLSIRSYNALKRAGIDKVGQLAAKKPEEILRIRNVGQLVLAEICFRLDAFLERNRLSLDSTHPSQANTEYVQPDSSSGPHLAAEQLRPLEESKAGSEPDSTSARWKLTVVQAATLSYAQPEEWADLVTGCKLGYDWYPRNDEQAWGPNAAKLDHRFTSSLSARTQGALMRSGIYSLDALARMRVSDLARVRNLGRKAAIEIFHLVRSEARSLSDGSQSQIPVDTNPAQTPKPIEQIPSELGLLTLLQRRLTEEIHGGRLHPKVRLADVKIATWIDPDYEFYDENALRRLSRLVDRKVGYLTIDDELAALRNSLKHRHAETLMSRFGEHPETLQEIGDRFGVTRERVRQLEYRAVDLVAKWLNSDPWRLKSALLLLDDSKNEVSLQTWESMLAERGLISRASAKTTGEHSTGSRTIEVVLVCLRANASAQKPARGFDIPPNLLAASEFVRLTEDEAKASRALTRKELGAILRQCCNAGGASLTLLGRKYKIPASALAKILLDKGYIRVDEEWVALKPIEGKAVSPHYLPFLALVTKMLTICGPLPAEEITEGLESHISRKRRGAPPASIMKKLLPIYGFTSRGDERFDLPIDGRVAVQPSAAERAILEVISNRGPVVNFSELSEQFTAKGYSQPGLTVTLRHSVLFKRVDFGLYTLRGTVITRESIESALDRRPDVDQHGSLHYSTDGTISWEINVGTFGSGGTIPSGEASRLAGEWRGIVDQTDAGRVKVGEQQIWGLAKAFRKLGIRVGERVALHFHPQDRQVYIEKMERSSNE